jgi:glucuronoarabinoxylan endo-1,4-beta-xylanase
MTAAHIATVDFSASFQRIDGFGFSQAFHRARLLRGDFGLGETHSREVLDLLMDPRKGAGLNILRLGIGSSDVDTYDEMKSIQPKRPFVLGAPPVCEWDGDDGGQLWLAKEARRYGVRRFHAVAWSAPGYMKTNGSDKGGGTLLGVPGTENFGEDWRRAYADYLIEYVRCYRREGIKITDIAFVNEPELGLLYASMEFSAKQLVDLARVVGDRIAASDLRLALVCCEAMDWEFQLEYTRAIEADPIASGYIDIHSAHGYVDVEKHGKTRRRLTTERPIWMTEWVPDLHGKGGWDETWDGRPSSGIRVAADIHDSLTVSGVSAYIYWFGASTGTTRALIQVEGNKYRVSKRLWALAAFSRFIRPGAHRVRADARGGGRLKIAAFANRAGNKVLTLLNLARTASDLVVQFAGTPPVSVQAFLTDEHHSLEAVKYVAPAEGVLTASLPPRSLTTVVLD